MALNDPIADVLSHILNSENSGKQECLVKPSSKIVNKVLSLMKDNNYISEFKNVENSRDLIKVNLIGLINKTNVIKPRYPFKKGQLEKYERRYLPGKGIGMLIVSTPKGIMTHRESIEKGLGGRLIAYVY